MHAQVQPTASAAHDRYQLLMDDADEGLTRRQTAHHLGANRTGFDRLDEGLDHRQRDVGFEQREAHLGQRLGDVVFGQSAATTQSLRGAGESFGE